MPLLHLILFLLVLCDAATPDGIWTDLQQLSTDLAQLLPAPLSAQLPQLQDIELQLGPFNYAQMGPQDGACSGLQLPVWTPDSKMQFAQAMTAMKSKPECLTSLAKAIDDSSMIQAHAARSARATAKLGKRWMKPPTEGFEISDVNKHGFEVNSKLMRGKITLGWGPPKHAKRWDTVNWTKTPLLIDCQDNSMVDTVDCTDSYPSPVELEADGVLLADISLLTPDEAKTDEGTLEPGPKGMWKVTLRHPPVVKTGPSDADRVQGTEIFICEAAADHMTGTAPKVEYVYCDPGTEKMQPFLLTEGDAIHNHLPKGKDGSSPYTTNTLHYGGMGSVNK